MRETENTEEARAYNVTEKELMVCSITYTINESVLRKKKTKKKERKKPHDPLKPRKERNVSAT